MINFFIGVFAGFAYMMCGLYVFSVSVALAESNGDKKYAEQVGIPDIVVHCILWPLCVGAAIIGWVSRRIKRK